MRAVVFNGIHMVINVYLRIHVVNCLGGRGPPSLAAVNVCHTTTRSLITLSHLIYNILIP